MKLRRGVGFATTRLKEFSLQYIYFFSICTGCPKVTGHYKSFAWNNEMKNFSQTAKNSDSKKKFCEVGSGKFC